jgi:hypothetical protein
MINLINKINKAKIKIFKLLKKNLLKRKKITNIKLDMINKFKSKKYGKANAKINDNLSFLIIYLFLIDKNTALVNMKLLFSIESLLRKNLIKGAQNGLIRSYGKKTLKALGIKNKKRNKYNKLLVFIEKNQISHAVKTILKYLLIIK